MNINDFLPSKETEARRRREHPWRFVFAPMEYGTPDETGTVPGIMWWPIGDDIDVGLPFTMRRKQNHEMQR